MQSFVAGVANTVYADMVAKLDGEPIVGGVVNFYLLARTGENAGKWFKTSDDSWSAVEAVAAVGSHVADGHWSASIDLAAWTDNIKYILYAKESGDLHIPYCEAIESDVADAVWDELISITAHNVSTSAGRRLRLLGTPTILDGQIEDPITNQTVTLGAEALAVANIYNENLITITSGTGIGQTRLILEYGADKKVTVDRAWDVLPVAGDFYQVWAFSGILLVQHGTAQSGAASSITLATTALNTANSYVGCAVVIVAGAGAGQTRTITSYAVGRIATVSPAWEVGQVPDATSVYKILPVGLTVDQNINVEGTSTQVTDA